MFFAFKKQKYRINKLFCILLFILTGNSAMAFDEVPFTWESFQKFSISMGIGIATYAYLYRYGISHLVEFKETLLGSYDAERETCYSLMKYHRGSRVVDMPNFYTVYMPVDKAGRESKHSSNFYLYPTSLELIALPLEMDQAVYKASQKHYLEIYKAEKNKYEKKTKSKKIFEKTKQFERLSVNWRGNKQEIYAFCLYFYNNSSLFFQCVNSIYQYLPTKNYWDSIVVYRNQNSSSWLGSQGFFKGLAPVFYIDSSQSLILNRWIFVESVFNKDCGLNLVHTNTDATPGLTHQESDSQ